MTSKQALLVLLATLLAFFGPLLVRGEVVFPHDNSVELGVRDAQPSARFENRRFSDLSSVYVPEIHHHLHGDRTRWLSTWNPHVELGRPTIQISGLSPVHPITRLLSWVTGDACALYTALVLVTVALTALFGFLFLDALGLDRRACVAAAAWLALGVYPIYWLAFVMYVASLAWTLCLLWATTRFVERPSAGRGLWIAFAVYMLLLGGYPQQILWHAALVAGFAISRTREWRPLVALGAWAALGVACAAPVYIDLALQASLSTRAGMDPEFFREALPETGSLPDLGVFLAQLFDASWFGNPIAPEYPRTFKGLSLTPVVCGLVLACAAGGVWRRAWAWIAFALLCLLLTLWPDAYLFAVEHLGLGFSRFTPLAAALIPLGVCSAIAMDRLLLGEVGRSALLPLAIATGVVIAGASVASLAIHAGLLAAGLALAVLLGLAVWAKKPAWIPALVVLSVLWSGARLVLSRPESEIHRTSPLVERIRRETEGGLRYALVGFLDERLLPPNQEAMLGLRSIHAYDPLAPRAYREWVLRISESGMRTSGRQFRRIASGARLGGDEVGRAGIGLFVSTIPLDVPRLVDAGEVDGVRLYRVREMPALEAQLATFARQAGEVRTAGISLPQTRLPVSRADEHDDRVRFRVTPAPATTLLFVSQQFHPQWRASSKDGPLETVRVDGFYQGVLVPPSTDEVELRFEPFARWSWIPQLVLALGAIATLARALVTRSSRRR